MGSEGRGKRYIAALLTALQKLAQAGGCASVLVGCFLLSASAGEKVLESFARTLLSVEGSVQVSRLGSEAWDRWNPEEPLQGGDRIRTGPRSRCLVRISEQTTLRMGELSLLEIPARPGERLKVRIRKGLFYFFHREKPGEYEIQSPGISTIIRGTEFVVEVAGDDSTRISVVDGEVEMSRGEDRLSLRSGQSGKGGLGEKPTLVPALAMSSVIQWILYYPGVLHLGDLELSAAETATLADSLTNYAVGDLKGALEQFPHDRSNLSPSQRLYLAGLVLSVGKVEEANVILDGVEANPSSGGEARHLGALCRSPRRMVSLAQGTDLGLGEAPGTATEWLVEAYARQAQGQLQSALEAAKRAVALAPDFAFAWEQVAELQFGMGNVHEARRSLERSLALAPRNAQARALQGFLLLADGRTTEARAAFDQAIALDGALGNAWLGRGLAQLRRGQTAAGLQDLEAAAALEPQRAVLRSYLAKAYQAARDPSRAGNEIRLAKELDPGDPTGWFYSALLLRQQGRFNEAAQELERSLERNQNRAVFRSDLLLDQDRAVRGANLAGIYRDAGMPEVGFREASKAVSADYADYSAHLFLAGSYDALRDPRQVSLRYETPWLQEYLLSQLLAPVGAGELSPAVTQYEYSRLFERDRISLWSDTEYGSRGDWRQTASQFGRVGGSSYAVDVGYTSQNGERPNQDLEQLNLALRYKQRLGPQDTLFLQVGVMDMESGDLAQYYDPTNAFPNLRIQESQTPQSLVGYHHEWNPGSHTLFLGGYLQDTLEIQNPDQPVLAFLNDVSGTKIDAAAYPQPPTASLRYQNDYSLYSCELQQIWQGGGHSVVVGGRYQTGEFDTWNELGASTPTAFANEGRISAFKIPTSPVSARTESAFERWSLYGYDFWRIVDPLILIAGISYDSLRYPGNFRFPPISSSEEEEDRLLPKAGVVWTPFAKTTFRGAYSRSLGGVSFERSFQLEPSQVAGFTQSFRSVVPESVAGSISAERVETMGAGVEQKIGATTFLGLQFQQFNSTVSRADGAMAAGISSSGVRSAPMQLREDLEYEERELAFTANQLFGRYGSLGVRYSLGDAQIQNGYPELPASVTAIFRETDQSAQLQRVHLYGLFYHPKGPFTRLEGIWTGQSNSGDAAHLSGADFWQWNWLVGYRLADRRVELSVGILNLTDTDYRVNPLNLTYELPRSRTFVLSLKWLF